MSVPSVHEIKGSLAASAWSNTSCAARRRSRFLLSHRSPRVRDVAAFGVRSFLGYSIDPVCGQLMNSCQLSPTHFRVHEPEKSGTVVCDAARAGDAAAQRPRAIVSLCFIATPFGYFGTTTPLIMEMSRCFSPQT